jgi:hypothetical protein
MAGLDGDHRCSDLDAFGDVSKKGSGRHRIEIAGYLWNPE